MDDIRIFIEIIVGAVVSCGGFFVGRKKSNAEANRTAYEAFNFALESLRDEMKSNAERFNEVRKALEAKIDEQAMKIESQGKRISELEEENRSLKAKISEFKPA